MKKRIFYLLIIISLIFSFLVVIFAFLRYPTQLISINVPINPEAGQGGNSDQIMVALEIPDKLQIDEEAQILVEINQIIDNSQNVLLNPDSKPESELYTRYYVNFEGRIEIPGIHVNSPGKISSNLIKDGNINFEWDLKPYFPGVFDGTIWLYVNLIPKHSNEATIHQVLLAKPFKIEVFSIFNMSSPWIKAISILILSLNTLIVLIMNKSSFKIGLKKY